MEIQRVRRIMAAPFQVTLRGADEKYLAEAALDAFLCARRIEELLSRFLPDTEIGILNHLAAREPVRVEPSTFALLRRCREYWEWSRGALDVSVAPLLALWGIGGRGRVPDDEEIAAAMRNVGMDKVLFEDATSLMAFAAEGVALDLGAVGKGAALDAALALLRDKWRIGEALLSFGRSSIGVIGGPWEIKVTCPHDQERTALTVALADRTLSMSSIGPRRFLQDAYAHAEVDHIIDPRTGRPKKDVLNVTAIMANAEAAEALTTALIVLGEDEAPAVAARFGAETVIFTRPRGDAAVSRILDVASATWTEVEAEPPPR
ncbi:MAG TPA: hypothetical protein DCM87_13565 [Planctomycetes bacterium]|nr:hypothetical protein [Planctomycetota bacterium]